MNSFKAAMVIIVLGLAGLFASCSGDSANNIDPITPSTQEQVEQKAEVAKVKLAYTYTFTDGILEYAEPKVVYTDASGKEQTEIIDKTKCTAGKNNTYDYTLNLETTTFPSTMTVKMDVTGNEEAIENAKDSVRVGFGQNVEYTKYDKNGKEIGTYVMPVGKILGTLVQLPAKSMKEYFMPIVKEQLKFYDMDQTFTFSVDASKSVSHEFK